MRVSVGALDDNLDLVLHLEELLPKDCSPSDPLPSHCEWAPLQDHELQVQRDPSDPFWTGVWEDAPVGWVRIKAILPESDFESHPQELEIKKGPVNNFWLFLYETRIDPARTVPAVLSVEVDAAEATPGQTIHFRVRGLGVGTLELTGFAEVPPFGTGVCQGTPTAATFEGSNPVVFDPSQDEKGDLYWVAPEEPGELLHPLRIRIEDETGSSSTVLLHMAQNDPCSGDCGEVCSDLCSDPQNCGACGNDCHALPNVAEAECTDSGCEIITCDQGWDDCDDDPSTGCEAHLGSCSVITKVVAGGWSTCALEKEGRIFCWGDNGSGQLGKGDTQSTTSPTLVTGISDAADVHINGPHACAILKNGQAYCWGNNGHGQLGDNSQEPSTTPVSVTQEEAIFSQVTVGFTNHTCAIEASGSVYCWGSNHLGKLGDDDEGNNKWVPVEAEVLTDVDSVSAGTDHTCAVRDGHVYCWGAGYDNRLGFSGPVSVPTLVPNVSNAAQVALGDAHSCARLQDGKVRCWGKSSSGELGGFLDYPVFVDGVSTAIDIDAGYSHSCAALNSGKVVCWGLNNQGQLGDGTTTNRTSPVEVQGLSIAKNVSTGGVHSCALTTSNEIYCWGANSNGQLGDGTTTGKLTPVKVQWGPPSP